MLDILEIIIYLIIAFLLSHFEIKLSDLPLFSYFDKSGLQDETRSALINLAILIMIGLLKGIFSAIKFLKKGFNVEIVQKNKNTSKCETNFYQRNITEKNRTVIITLSMTTKSSIWNYFLIKYLRKKTIKLNVGLEYDDQDYITIDLNRGKSEGSFPYFDIKNYLLQCLRNQICGEEKFSYIISLNLEPEEEKDGKCINIIPQLLIDNKDLKERFVLKRLFKFSLLKHSVDFKIEKGSSEE